MGKALKLLSLALTVAFLRCATSQPASALDEYAIYVDFLGQVIWDRSQFEKVDIKRLVIEATTSTRGMAFNSETPWKITRWHRNNLPRLEQSTVKSFEACNQVPLELEAARFTEIDVVLITKEETSQIFTRGTGGDGWWPEFYERFPDAQGILTLSRVGISSDGTQALLYYGNQWAGLAGVGEMVVLERSGDRWKIAERVEVWVS